MIQKFNLNIIKYAKYILCFKKLFSTFGLYSLQAYHFGWRALTWIDVNHSRYLDIKKTTYFVLQKRACAAARETRPVKRSSESARHKISTRQDLGGVKILVKNEFDCEIKYIPQQQHKARGLLLLRVSLIKNSFCYLY